MSKTVRVNVRTAINASGIRRERRDGRDYIIVPSATMPDGVVMNRVRYPAAAIEKSFGSLENTPAPLGHPSLEGAFVSAKDPEGLARGWIGAWNRNVRRENGRVFIDKVIDVATASHLPGGKAVLEAIDKGEPIHSSTGLYAIMTAVENDADADYEASDIVFDHDAILLGEDGAATPAQGVGLLVNAATAPDGEKVEVINSTLDDDIEREMRWAAESIVRAVERKEQEPLIERMFQFMMRIVKGEPAPEKIEGLALNAEHDTMDKAQFDELKGMVEGLAASIVPETKITELVNAAIKPMADAQAARDAADKAKAEEEHAALVNAAVDAKLLDEADAKATPATVLTALLNRAKTPLPAMRVNAAFRPEPKQTDRATLAPKGE